MVIVRVAQVFQDVVHSVQEITDLKPLQKNQGPLMVKKYAGKFIYIT